MKITSFVKSKKINKELENVDIPWKDKIQEDYHVVIYKDSPTKNLLFVPKYNTPGVLQDAFYDAYKYGTDLVKSGSVDGFNLELYHGKCAGQEIDYPYIRLIPKFEDTDKEQSYNN